MNELDQAEIRHELRQQLKDMGLRLSLKALEYHLTTSAIWAELLSEELQKLQDL